MGVMIDLSKSVTLESIYVWHHSIVMVMRADVMLVVGDLSTSTVDSPRSSCVHAGRTEALTRVCLNPEK